MRAHAGDMAQLIRRWMADWAGERDLLEAGELRISGASPLEALSVLSGVPKDTISRILKGRTEWVRWDAADKLVVALGVQHLVGTPLLRVKEPPKLTRAEAMTEVLREWVIDQAEGTPLPSMDWLRQRFGVGIHPIQEAMRELHDEGLVTIRQGSRTRVGRGPGYCAHGHQLTQDNLVDNGDGYRRCLECYRVSSREYQRRRRARGRT
jgi:hypothetical protein